MMRCLLLSLVAIASLVALDHPVVEVTGPDRLVVLYRQIPVSFTLANLEVPDDASLVEACKAKLAELVNGQEVSVLYKDAFGVDESGTAKVHVKVGRTHVNLELIAAGLARFVDGAGKEPTYDRMLEMAQERAEKDKLGLWGAAAPQPEEPVVAAVAPKPAVEETPPFAAELNGRYYYPSDSPEVANVNKRRLIFYRSEAEARSAGKQPPPQASSGGGEVSASAADGFFTKGKLLYSQAIDAGNTSKRDDLYAQAFSELTQAMQIYSSLLEKDENNAALQERLRETMQLRYGAMKQRRY